MISFCTYLYGFHTYIIVRSEKQYFIFSENSTYRNYREHGFCQTFQKGTFSISRAHPITLKMLMLKTEKAVEHSYLTLLPANWNFWHNLPCRRSSFRLHNDYKRFYIKTCTAYGIQPYASQPLFFRISLPMSNSLN